MKAFNGAMMPFFHWHTPGTYVDVTEHIQEAVVTNADGWGDFKCDGRAVSVWVPEAQ